MKKAWGLTRRLVVTAAIVLAMAARADAAEPKDCSLKVLASIDLIGHENAPILPITLNGKKAGLALRLDSIASTIASSSADKWALPRRMAPPATVRFGETPVRDMAEYEELIVGDLKYPKGFFLVAPIPIATPTVDGVEVIGWLSGSALRGVDFELDLAHRKLKVFSQDHCEGQVVYWADQYSSAELLHGKTGELFFAVELEGKKVYAAISNSRPTQIGTDVTRAFFGFDKSSPGVQKDVAPDGSTYYYRTMQLTAPGLTVTDARVLLFDHDDQHCSLDRGRKVARYRCAGGYPMYLGSDVLRKLRLYFARKEGKLYYTAADTTSASSETRVQVKPQ